MEDVEIKIITKLLCEIKSIKSLEMHGGPVIVRIYLLVFVTIPCSAFVKMYFPGVLSRKFTQHEVQQAAGSII